MTTLNVQAGVRYKLASMTSGAMEKRMSKKIIHVVIDNKFIDMAIREFEAVAPGIHEYYLIDAKFPYSYIKDPKVHGMTRRELCSEARREDVTAIIFHFITPDKHQLLEQLPPTKKIFWLGWGADYYDALLAKSFPAGLLGPKTVKLNQGAFGERIRQSSKSAIKKSLRWAVPRWRHDLLKRVDYFSPVLDVEYHMACEHNPWFRAKYIPWNYGTAEDDMIPQNITSSQLGNNLLVGNSATATCNHFENFEIICERIDLADRKVIVPLSYGDPVYREKIIRIGSRLLGPHFVPLIDFMPKEQYMAILRSCGFVMMNHFRQQALGNICISSLMGAKVFLNRANPLFRWLEDKGLTLGDFESPDISPLTDHECANNRNAIIEHWGRAAQRKRTHHLVSLALS